MLNSNILFRKLKAFWKPSPKPIGVISKEILGRYLPPFPVIVEAGAHVGSDTVEMAKLWENAIIHAFEPVPNLYNQLTINTQNLPNVKTYPYALTEISGEVELFVSSGKSNASSSILTPKEHLTVHPDVYFNEKIRVEGISLYDWSNRLKIQKVDMLWLDLQGYELPVLKNSGDILRGVSVIYTEVNLIENYQNTALYSELKNWLAVHNFHVEIEELPWRDGGNVLFIKNQIK